MYVTTPSTCVGISQEECIKIRLTTEPTLECMTQMFSMLENTKNDRPTKYLILLSYCFFKKRLPERSKKKIN